MSLERFSIFTRDAFTDRQTTLFFYKVETHLDRLLVPEIYVKRNFVKIVRAVLEIVNTYVPTRFSKKESENRACRLDYETLSNFVE